MPLPRSAADARQRAVDPLAVLRARTADVHAALDAGLPLRRDDLDRAGYATALAGFLALHAPLEHAVHRALAGAGGPEVTALRWRDGHRAHLARRDLADLAATGVLAPAPAPAVAFVDVVDGVATAVGALYVAEGSTLGGAILAAHVRRVLGSDVPVRFLAPAGATARWRAFRVAARGVLNADDEVEAAAGAACAVFARFAGVLLR